MNKNTTANRSTSTVKLGIFVRLESNPGKESEIERFLIDALPLVQEELGTSLWFAIRLGKSSFGIFDAFVDEEGREAHLHGKVAAALFARAPMLFSKPPIVEKADILAVKC